jgi:RNA exonuclease NGL2
VHTSVEKIEESLSAPPSNTGTGTNTPTPALDDDDKSNDEEEEEDKDEQADSHEFSIAHETSIANTRYPTHSDGIVPIEELVRLIQGLIPDGLKSAYGDIPWSGVDGSGETFGGRGGFERVGGQGDLGGDGEIGWSCYTPLFKLTLGESRLRFLVVLRG